MVNSIVDKLFYFDHFFDSNVSIPESFELDSLYLFGLLWLHYFIVIPHFVKFDDFRKQKSALIKYKNLANDKENQIKELEKCLSETSEENKKQFAILNEEVMYNVRYVPIFQWCVYWACAEASNVTSLPLNSISFSGVPFGAGATSLADCRVFFLLKLIIFNLF